MDGFTALTACIMYTLGPAQSMLVGFTALNSLYSLSRVR